MTTATGSARGVPALSRLRRPSRSTGKRCGRSCTRASAAGTCAYVCPTPTVTAHWSSAPRMWPQRWWRVDCRPDRSGTDVQWIAHGITIPAGALVVSDPVTLDVPALGDLAVSLYLPENVAATTQHVGPANDLHLGSWQLHRRDHCRRRPRHVLLLSDRRRSPRLRAREGDRDAGRLGHRRLRLNARHESALAEFSGRAAAVAPGTSRVAVLNAGVSGNRMLHDFVGTSALARFDRDVLVRPA